MTLIELRDILSKEIDNGFGQIQLLVDDGDGGLENSTELEFNTLEGGYIIY